MKYIDDIFMQVYGNGRTLYSEMPKDIRPTVA